MRYALFCVDECNSDEIIVCINSFVLSNPNISILISHTGDLNEKVALFLVQVKNNIKYLEFKQKVDEDRLVIKTLERLIDSDCSSFIYFKSTTIVCENLSDFFSSGMEGNLVSACREYSFSSGRNSNKAYQREDPRFHVRFEHFGMNHLNTDVLRVNLTALRRHPINLNNISDTMNNHLYYLKPSLSEFVSFMFKDSPKSFLNSRFNEFGDKYLFNTRPYNKMIRSNFKFYKSSVQNFSECKPWDSKITLNRSTIQYPVDVYESYLHGIEEFLSDCFIYNIKVNGLKWRKRLNKLPEIFNKYYGR